MTGVWLACRVVLVCAALGVLAACALPERAPSLARYDFGASAATPAIASARLLPSLAISVQAAPVLDGTAMRYRLMYADVLQLRSYALSRWTLPPAELVQQRVREALSRQYVLRQPGAGAGRELRIALEEFSQVFAAPDQSKGVLRLRMTLLQASSKESQVMAQRDLVIERPAPSLDAAGGAHALAAATDAAVAELLPWLLSQ